MIVGLTAVVSHPDQGGAMNGSIPRITTYLLLLALTATPALSVERCKPVNGHFEANLVSPGQGHCPADPNAFCTAGRVWGGIQGNYQFVMTGALPTAAISGTGSSLFFTGKSTIFLKSDDVLLGTDTGTLDPPPAGQGGFASLITFDGGTGSMAGATGQIRLRGELDPVEGTTSGDYVGKLCTLP
jgi:hypothetical protein